MLSISCYQFEHATINGYHKRHHIYISPGIYFRSNDRKVRNFAGKIQLFVVQVQIHPQTE